MLPGHRDIVPVAVVNGAARRHGTDPTDIEHEPAAADEQRLAIRHPAIRRQRLAEDTAAGPRSDSRCDRVIATRPIELVGLGHLNVCRAVERQRPRGAVGVCDLGPPEHDRFCLLFARRQSSRTGNVGDLQDQVLGSRTDLKSPRKDRRGRHRFDAGGFQHGSVADRIGHQHLVAEIVQAAVMCPVARQRSVGTVVAAAQTRVVERARIRVGPTGPRRVGQVNSADQSRMDAVAAVEQDRVPIDETPAAPRRRHAERVVIVQQPMSTPRHAAGTGIQANRDALVGKVCLVAAHFVTGCQTRPVIHRDPGLERLRRWTAAGPGGQLGQVRVIDSRILSRVVGLQVRLADVMDDVVLLLRDHPGLRHHHAVTFG